MTTPNDLGTAPLRDAADDTLAPLEETRLQRAPGDFGTRIPGGSVPDSGAPIEGQALVDIQSSGDERGVALERAGVSGVRHPLKIRTRDGQEQTTVAALSLSVAVPPGSRGTHMSRFLELLQEQHGALDAGELLGFMPRLQARLESDDALVEIAFPLFLERAAPASGARGLLDYACRWEARRTRGDDQLHVEVCVPVTSLCPCSKAISDYGAHNQRGHVTIDIEPMSDAEGRPLAVPFEDLIEVAESAASCPVYPVLKRSDERHVTMQAYDNPVFVEDMVRNVAVRLREDARIAAFRVHVVNFESIHNHDAFAETSWRRAHE